MFGFGVTVGDYTCTCYVISTAVWATREGLDAAILEMSEACDAYWVAYDAYQAEVNSIREERNRCKNISDAEWHAFSAALGSANERHEADKKALKDLTDKYGLDAAVLLRDSREEMKAGYVIEMVRVHEVKVFG